MSATPTIEPNVHDPGVHDPRFLGPRPAGALSDGAERWAYICRYADLIPGRGVAALVDGEQVAVFRLRDGSLRAVGNYDPCSKAYVISRGITGTHNGVVTVASPIYKDLFDLRTGACLGKEGLSLPTYAVYQHRGLVFCQEQPLSSSQGAKP